jgi:hypothetical protein
MRYMKWLRFAVVAGTLAGWTAACDFVEPTSSNPNTLPNATIDQMFVSSQISAWFFNEGDLSRHASVWFQQMSGTDRQGTGIENYQVTEVSLEPEWGRVYGSGEARTGGGLLDLRRGQEIAEGRGSRGYAGILKIHEAFMIGMAASVWGDMPYSQAVNIDEFPTPEFDEQADVYAAIQTLLDEAIADLESGESIAADESLADVDMVYGGDVDSWLAVAWTLKARFYMHWAEVNGAANYTLARDAALNGIADAGGDWKSVHSSTLKESNLWYQFVLDRDGYISGGNLVFLMDLDDDGNYTAGVDDPRLPLYYTVGQVCQVGFDCTAGDPLVDKYAGSPTGSSQTFFLDGVEYQDPGTDASQLNEPATADYGHRLAARIVHRESADHRRGGSPVG